MYKKLNILTKISLSIRRWKNIITKIKLLYKRVEALENNVDNLIINNYHKYSEIRDQKAIFKLNEYKVYSQNGEDGILMYIFSKIGIQDNTVVEIGIGDGAECNSRNLIENFGWNAWLIEGSKKNAGEATSFYDGNHNVNVRHEWITKDNIENVLTEAGVPDSIDLLSIDIDGNDYWIWERIDRIKPRAVIIEYNASFGNNRSVTVPYDPEFDRFKKHKSGYYHGASLNAMEKLCYKKGYTLVCCDSNGVNAFFIREDLLDGTSLHEITATDAYYTIRKRDSIMSPQEQYNLIKYLGFVKV